MAEIAESDLREAKEDLDRIDYSTMTAGELADHIIVTHHVFLRRELPRLFDLLGKVVAAHGPRHPELAKLCNTLTDLRQELESHMIKEERVLFPLVKQLEEARAPFPIHCGTVENPIRVMVHEHRTVGLRPCNRCGSSPTDTGARERLCIIRGPLRRPCATRD